MSQRFSSLRQEIVHSRAQDRRDIDQQVAAICSSKMQSPEIHEEFVDEIREELWQAQDSIAALSLRPELCKTANFVNTDLNVK